MDTFLILENFIKQYLKKIIRNLQNNEEEFYFENWSEELQSFFKNKEILDGYGSILIENKYAILNDYAEEDDFSDSYANVICVLVDKILLYEINKELKIKKTVIEMPFILKSLKKLGGKRSYYVKKYNIKIRYEGNLISIPYRQKIYKYSIPKNLLSKINKNYAIFTNYKKAKYWYLENTRLKPYEIFGIGEEIAIALDYPDNNNRFFYFKNIKNNKLINVYPAIEETILNECFTYTNQYIQLKITKKELTEIIFKLTEEITITNSWKEIEEIINNKTLKKLYLKINIEEMAKKPLQINVHILKEKEKNIPLIKDINFLLFNL